MPSLVDLMLVAKAVANSGGPDSVSLLFLLSSVLSGREKSPPPKLERLFESLVSISVNHQLQKCSSDMSNHAARVAASLGTDHLTVEIPWSTPPYVPKPDAGAPLESIARDARYSVLFGTMNSVGAEAIAVGHHADDQVETFLMRIAKGTSVFGLGGMKPVRRFGMGGVADGKMGWFGHVGMDRWIVRPLLGVSKVNHLVCVVTASIDTDIVDY
jgi:tRNA(Ile)-lysidine synthase